MCYYTHRSVVLSALVREASFCSGHWLMQRLITCQSAKNSCLLSAHPKTVFLHCFLQGPRNTVGEGSGKNTRAQWQRRVPCNIVTWHDHGNLSSCGCIHKTWILLGISVFCHGWRKGLSGSIYSWRAVGSWWTSGRWGVIFFSMV